LRQHADSLWDEALSQLRLSNYRCYFLLALHDDLGFSYEEIIAFLQSPSLQLEGGQIFELGELIEIVEAEQKKLNFNNPDTVKNAASKCRQALHALAARLVGKIEQPSKTFKP
jgi:hypothetical protein